MNVYLARQPILNRRQKTVAYEMLYRCSSDNRYSPEWDGTETTKKLLHNMMLNFGFDYVTKGKRAFLNFTDTLLCSNTPLLLPSDRVVIELLETIHYTDEVIGHMRMLKQCGYIFALDDYIGQTIPDAVMDLVDIIKVDWMGTSHNKRVEIVQNYGKQKELLAEKVETEADYQEALEMGFDFFQGFYFARPTLHFKKVYDISVATYIRLWEEISCQSVDMEKLAKIIELDIGATYKLLCKANTLQYFHTHRVHSIQQALMIIGTDEVRRWILLLLLNNLSDNHNEEAVQQALIRGVFAEHIAAQIAEQTTDMEYQQNLSQQAYMMGMFSIIDEESQDMLHDMMNSGPSLREIRGILSGQDQILNDILQFIILYEKNESKESEQVLVDFLEKYHINFEQVAQEYIQAVCYAEQAFCVQPAEITPDLGQRLNLPKK